MGTRQVLEIKVLGAARDNGTSSVLFRNEIGKKLGLNITDSQCLSLLSIKGTSTPTQLAEHTGLTTGSATAMLDRLEKAQFIKRLPNPKDRRGVVVEINKKYREQVGPLVMGVQKAHNQLLSNYSDQELETIADFLTRFTDNVEESTKAIKKGLANHF